MNKPMEFPALRLQNKKVIFRPFLGDDLVAEIDGLRAGWILKGHLPSSPIYGWWWTIIGPSCGMSRVNHVGQCQFRKEAKIEFRTAFGHWLAWALQQHEPVKWFGVKAH